MIEGTRRDDFRRFFGRVHPVFALLASMAAGAGAVAVLRSRDWGFVDVLAWSTPGVFIAVAAATVFAGIAVVADSTIGFADDINVPWPRSAVFYPVVALVAVAVFHLIPLAVLTLVFGLDFAGTTLEAAALVCVVVVALVETTFQVVASRTSGARPALVMFVGVHVFVIGLAQVLVLWRFGVWPMLVFRLVYYAQWHVTWGHYRLAPDLR